ncbi:Glycosyl hydrolase 9B1 isoform 1 [Hibiscus syriacus]|uniref:Glycosyl hydrolase 9B1 isoform 1 n=1 Tax=Hibiscus syriacus TaxID=106335 RepID=A0A6A3BLA3_HIBSY|nr:21 kDa protein-like [Hibiscus syriacus]KAE8716641.1 Glycosyl hydrolase 9B1 isoform 1 [Hibiscus syriacus]
MKPFSFFFFFLFHFYPVPTLGYAVYEARAAVNPTDFIRTSCFVTLYPDVCYSSLSRYANAIQQDPARLARAAIGVTLSKARKLAVYVSNISREADYGADARASAALHDCFSNMGDAVDEIRGSLKQMMQTVGPGSESFRFQMGNVQTWMSAALTDEETCTDGLEDVAEGGMKREVVKRAAKVKKLTSNALALVNSYVEKGTM